MYLRDDLVNPQNVSEDERLGEVASIFARVVHDPYLRMPGVPDPDIFIVSDLPPLRPDRALVP
jgi:hypothetical protein